MNDYKTSHINNPIKSINTKIEDDVKNIFKCKNSAINIRILALNCQSVNAFEPEAKKKLIFIKRIVIDNNIDIVFLIDVGKRNKEINIVNYRKYEDDRNLLLIKNNLKPDVTMKNNLFVLKGCDLNFTYIRPNEENKTLVDEVCTLIENNKCVIGDLNIRSNYQIAKCLQNKEYIGEETEQTILIKKKIKSSKATRFNAPSDHKAVIFDVKRRIPHNSGMQLISIKFDKTKEIVDNIFKKGKFKYETNIKQIKRLNEGDDDDNFTKEILFAYLKRDFSKCYKCYEKWWKKLKKEPFLGTEIPDKVEETLKLHYRHDENKTYILIDFKCIDAINLDDLKPKKQSYSKAATFDLALLKDIDRSLKEVWDDINGILAVNECEDEEDINDIELLDDRNEFQIKEDVIKAIKNFVTVANKFNCNLNSNTFFLKKNKTLESFHDIRIIVISPILVKIWESLIYDTVVRYITKIIEKNGKYQYGGVIHGSTYSTIFDVQTKYQLAKGQGLLFIDIEKGYDSVIWKVLEYDIGMLEDLSIKSMLTIWLTLVQNTDAIVNHKKIKKSRGLGMGLTLAPIMFVYYVHRALAIAKINWECISMYIDDLVLILQGVDKDIDTYNNIKVNFKIRDMNINPNKCSILTVNNSVKKVFDKSNIRITNCEKYLGVQLMLDSQNNFVADHRFLYFKREFQCLPYFFDFAIKRLIIDGAIFAKLRYTSMMMSIKNRIEKGTLLRLYWNQFKNDFNKLSYMQLFVFSINFIKFFIDMRDIDYIKYNCVIYNDPKQRIKYASDIIREKLYTGIDVVDIGVKVMEIKITDPGDWPNVNMSNTKQLCNGLWRDLKKELINIWALEREMREIDIIDNIYYIIESKLIKNSKILQNIIFQHLDIYKIDVNMFIFMLLKQIDTVDYDNLKDNYNFKTLDWLIPNEEFRTDKYLKLWYKMLYNDAYGHINNILNKENKKEYKEYLNLVIKILICADNILTKNKRNWITTNDYFYLLNAKLATNIYLIDIVTNIINNEDDNGYMMYDNDKDLGNCWFSVDGSFNPRKNLAGAGIVKYVRVNDKITKVKYYFTISDKYKEFRNVSGELMATVKAVEIAIKEKINPINIVFDYVGIAHYYNKRWSCNDILSSKYVASMVKYVNDYGLILNFFKVVSHTNVEYNEDADRLAKFGSDSLNPDQDSIKITQPLIFS